MSEMHMEAYSPNSEKVMEILLVEDNQADVDLTREAFQEARFYSDINVIKDGNEVLPYLRQEGKYEKAKRPDIIILDLTLPNKDGRQILEEIKSDWQLKIIPIIVMTSSDSDVDLFRSYSMGANSYVRKPLDFNEFANGIKAIGEFWFTLVKLPKESELSDFLNVSKTSFHAPRETDKRESKAKDICRVLMVEDNEAEVDLVKDFLDEASGRFEIEVAGTLNQAFRTMQAKHIDVILLDLTLPDSKGQETFNKFHLQYKDYPIVIYTVTDDMNFALGAMRAGAQDYLVKGEINSALLSRVLKYAVERNEIEKNIEKLLHISQAANESSQRAIFARDEFLSIVSHELKTPISILKLRSQILDKRWDSLSDDKKIHMIKDMDKQVDRLTATIGRLMDISRINAGHLKLEPEKFNLSALVQEVAERHSDNKEESNQIIHLRLDDTLEVFWDRMRIDQVLTNLLTNAFRYGEGKPITIITKKKNTFVVIHVKDEGPGIPADKLGTIFDRFQRATKKESSTGLGLGLYILRKIVEAHGGSVNVQSTIGKGTTFTVELPVITKVKGQFSGEGSDSIDEDSFEEIVDKKNNRESGVELH